MCKVSSFSYNQVTHVSYYKFGNCRRHMIVKEDEVAIDSTRSATTNQMFNIKIYTTNISNVFFIMLEEFQQ